MSSDVRKINTFLLFKLPSAFFCGVRAKKINNEQCVVAVKYRWINQNPFKSIYFAVLAMAAELSTGALVMRKIEKSGKRISMLVANSKASFTKKATGRILFKCNDGHLIDSAIERALQTGEGQTFWMKSVGTNQNGVDVAEMDFEWSIKIKS
jgi:hypothetical protein